MHWLQLTWCVGVGLGSSELRKEQGGLLTGTRSGRACLPLVLVKAPMRALSCLKLPKGPTAKAATQQPQRVAGVTGSSVSNAGWSPVAHGLHTLRVNCICLALPKEYIMHQNMHCGSCGDGCNNLRVDAC